jgi:hypothetical protein
MHFFSLELQKAGAINCAINGNFSAPKVQVMQTRFYCQEMGKALYLIIVFCFNVILKRGCLGSNAFKFSDFFFF